MQHRPSSVQAVQNARLPHAPLPPAAAGPWAVPTHHQGRPGPPTIVASIVPTIVASMVTSTSPVCMGQLYGVENGATTSPAFWRLIHAKSSAGVFSF